MTRHFLLLVLIGCGLLASALGEITLETRKNAIVVENGTHITHDAYGNMLLHQPSGKLKVVNSSLNAKPVQQKKTINGWLTSEWTYGTNYQYFSAEWIVPAAPQSSAGQIIYIFNSFENAAENNIIQPVLQWGNPTARWYLASWYVTSTGAAAESTPYAVNPGDRINGIISLGSGTWYIWGVVNGYLQTTLTVAATTVGGIQPTAQFTLEAYYVTACSQLPLTGSVTANNIYIIDNGYQITPTWYPNVWSYSPACYPGTYTSTPSQLTLTWYPY